MVKKLKIALSVFGILLALLIGAAVALPMLIDPNDYRDTIAKAVEKNTGRSLSLGQIELKVFPWIKLRVSEAELGNAAGFEERPFARVGTVDVGARLMPLLLDRRLEVSAVTLSGLVLNLERRADGSDNWSDLAGSDEQEQAAAETPTEAGGGFDPKKLDIAGVRIENATLRYSDAQAPMSLVVDQLNLDTGALAPGEAVDIETALRVSLDDPSLKAEIELAATVVPDDAFDRIAFEGIRLKVAADARQLVSKSDMAGVLTLDGDAVARLSEQVFSASGLRLAVTGTGATLMDGQPLGAALTLNGDVEANLKQGQIAARNLALSVQTGGQETPNPMGLIAQASLTGNPTLQLQDMVLDWPDLALRGEAEGGAIKRPAALRLTSALRYNGAQGTASLQKLVAEVVGVSLQAALDARQLNGEAPQVAGTVAVAPFSPRQVMDQLGIAYATRDGEVLSSAQFSAALEAGPTRAALKNLKLTLDDTTATGEVTVRDFATQALAFKLDVDGIDVDRYLPPADEAAHTGGKPAGDNGNINDIRLPTEVLDNLNADGTLRVGTLKVSGVTLTDASVSLSGPAGQPKRQQISAKLYGGQVNLDNRYTPGDTPRYALKTELDALKIAPFLADLLGKDYVSGLGRIRVDLTSAGETVGALRQALNGQLSFELRDGAVKGFNLAQVLRRGEAMLAGNMVAAREAANTAEETDFASFSAAAQIVNGVLKTDSLAAASPLFRLAGSGEVDLAKETINFLAKPTVVETATGQDGKALESLKGLTIPIQLTGSLFAPKVKLDIKEALQQKAFDGAREKLDAEKERVQEKIDAEKDRAREKLQDKLQEKLGPDAGEALRGLLGGGRRAATPVPSATPAPAPEVTPEPASAAEATPDAGGT